VSAVVEFDSDRMLGDVDGEFAVGAFEAIFYPTTVMRPLLEVRRYTVMGSSEGRGGGPTGTAQLSGLVVGDKVVACNAAVTGSHSSRNLTPNSYRAGLPRGSGRSPQTTDPERKPRSNGPSRSCCRAPAR
jgi:hypothetical protein